MVCDTWIFGERGLVDMLVLTYFFFSFLFFDFYFSSFIPSIFLHFSQAP